MTEWLKVSDCKSDEFTLRRFESYSLQIFILELMNSFFLVISSAGRAPRLQRGGQWFESVITNYTFLQIIY